MNAARLTKEALRRLIWRTKVVDVIDAHFQVTADRKDRVRCGDVAELVADKLNAANSWKHRRECRQAASDLGCGRVVMNDGRAWYRGMRPR